MVRVYLMLLLALLGCAPRTQPTPAPLAGPQTPPAPTPLPVLELTMRTDQVREGQFNLANPNPVNQTYQVRSTATWLSATPILLTVGALQNQNIRYTVRCNQPGKFEAWLQGSVLGQPLQNWMQVRMNCERPPDAATILRAVNAARQQPQRCGGQLYPPVQTLVWNSQLEQAALRHAQDLLRRNATRTPDSIALSHGGTDGTQVADRVSQTGYKWKMVGENIGWGFPGMTLEQAVSSWLASPSHCANLMTSGFTQMGVVSLRSPQGEFWVQVFGLQQ